MSIIKKLTLFCVLIAFIFLLGGCVQEEIGEPSSDFEPRIFQYDHAPEEILGVDPFDNNGDTPDIIVKQYFNFRIRKDWDSLYYVFSSKIPLTVEEFIIMHNESKEELLEYSVSEFIITSETNAAVKVEYLIDYNGELMVFIEWWGCQKEEGVWKLQWLPRQA